MKKKKLNLMIFPVNVGGLSLQKQKERLSKFAKSYANILPKPYCVLYIPYKGDSNDFKYPKIYTIKGKFNKKKTRRKN